MKFKPTPATAPTQQQQQPQDPRVGGRFQRMPDGSLLPLDVGAPVKPPAGEIGTAQSTTSTSE